MICKGGGIVRERRLTNIYVRVTFLAKGDSVMIALLNAIKN